MSSEVVGPRRTTSCQHGFWNFRAQGDHTLLTLVFGSRGQGPGEPRLSVMRFEVAGPMRIGLGSTTYPKLGARSHSRALPVTIRHQGSSCSCDIRIRAIRNGFGLVTCSQPSQPGGPQGAGGYRYTKIDIYGYIYNIYVYIYMFTYVNISSLIIQLWIHIYMYIYFSLF